MTIYCLEKIWLLIISIIQYTYYDHNNNCSITIMKIFAFNNNKKSLYILLVSLKSFLFELLKSFEIIVLKLLTII